MPPLPLLCLSLLCLSLCSFTSVRADIYDIDDTVVPYGQPIVRRVIAMYAASDISEAEKDAKGTSFIKLRLKAKTQDSRKASGAVHVHIIQSPDLSHVGFRADTATLAAAANANEQQQQQQQQQQQTSSSSTESTTAAPLTSSTSSQTTVVSYCCTQELLDAGACSSLNKLIVNDVPHTPPQTHTQTGTTPLTPRDHWDSSLLFVDSPTASITSDNTFHVKHTGEHILILSVCDPALVDTPVLINGISEWHNPYGYLPGRLFNFLDFFSVLSVLYGVFAFGWLGLSLYHFRSLAAVHVAISLVIGICMVEMLSSYFEYKHYNVTGQRQMEVVVWVMLTAVVRRTVSRMLMISASLGFGVVKTKLSLSVRRKVIVLGAIYFIADLILESVGRYSQVHTHVLDDRWRLLLSLPVAIINGVFYLWTSSALLTTIQHLRVKKQTAKLWLYYKLAAVIVFSLIAASAFAMYQIYFVVTSAFRFHWSQLWLLDGGFSMLLYTLILMTIAVLWRPTATSTTDYVELPKTWLDDELDEMVSQRGFGNQKREDDDDDDDDADEDEDEDEDDDEKLFVESNDNVIEMTQKDNQEMKLQASFAVDDDEHDSAVGGGSSASVRLE